jgi:hypothetical protein
MGTRGIEGPVGEIEALQNILRLEPDPIRSASGKDHRDEDALPLR